MSVKGKAQHDQHLHYVLVFRQGQLVSQLSYRGRRSAIAQARKLSKQGHTTEVVAA